jgi:hypothetical protein
MVMIYRTFLDGDWKNYQKVYPRYKTPLDPMKSHHKSPLGSPWCIPQHPRHSVPMQSTRSLGLVSRKNVVTWRQLWWVYGDYGGFNGLPSGRKEQKYFLYTTWLCPPWPRSWHKYANFHAYPIASRPFSELITHGWSRCKLVGLSENYIEMVQK